jgi:plasmid stabilization system protein ParE
MAFRIVWSQTAANDIKDVVRYISIDSPARAESFGFKIISEIDRLALSPHIGRAVPEYHCSAIREIIVGPYRVVYRLDDSSKSLEIARIWHAARGEPRLDQ